MSEIPLTSLAQRLIAANAIHLTAVQAALQQAKQQGLPFIRYLIQADVVAAAPLTRAIAADLGLPLLDLGTFDASTIPTEILIKALIAKHQMLPLARDGQQLRIALADPTDQVGLAEFKFHTGLTPQLVLLEKPQLTQLIQQVLAAQEVNALAAANAAALQQLTLDDQAVSAPARNPSASEDAPMVRYLDNIIVQAIRRNASDIHGEPGEQYYRIRYRIDGVLYTIVQLPVQLTHRLTARFKIMAQMDIAEKRLPQDGRFKMTLADGRLVDFRVSSCPVIHGEKICLRLLDAQQVITRIENLGLSSAQQALFCRAIRQPQGMLLVTGPTGSGKTVTLYTALNALNTDAINIAAIEDPVEIHVTGINQVTLNSRAGLDFALALRAFLRQDPDVIMLGEIRDLTTAEIAVKAAQTGHLVLSTLHTNSAAETLVRLHHMGVLTYNIATSVSLIIAQRLARRLCPHCKRTITLPAPSLIEAGFSAADLPNLTLYAPQGCEHCTQGYRGRFGLFEVLPVTETIREIVLRGGSALEVLASARQQGMQTLREAGLASVQRGYTSLVEINRVTVDEAYAKIG